jgi:hypothetical protein
VTAPNTEALKAARAIVAANNNPAHRSWIMEGRWDEGTLVQQALRDVLAGVPDSDGESE